MCRKSQSIRVKKEKEKKKSHYITGQLPVSLVMDGERGELMLLIFRRKCCLSM